MTEAKQVTLRASINTQGAFDNTSYVVIERALENKNIPDYQLDNQYAEFQVDYVGAGTGILNHEGQ